MWTVGRLTVDVVLQFRDWIKAKTGDPFAHLERFIDKLPAAEAVTLIKEAKAEQDQINCFSMQTPLAQRWMQTEEGMAEFLRLLLLPRHPDVTRDAAFSVAMAAGQQAVAEAIDKAHGQLPQEKNC